MADDNKPNQKTEFIPKRFMVISAHPDDNEFGVAGTVAKWTKHGSVGVYVLTTSGNGGTHDPAFTRETIGAHREEESLAAAKLCGVEIVEFLRYHDGEVMPTLELRKDYVRLIRKHKPEVVIAMDPTRLFIGTEYINHPDHRAVGWATMDAIAPVASMPLMYPELGEAHKVREVWVSAWEESLATTWVDITETLQQKKDALRCHKSQVGDDTVNEIEGWAWHAGKGLAPAETFRIMFLEKREAAVVKPADAQSF